MAVEYEWCVEEMDRDEDVIVDVNFFDTLKEALASAKDSSYDIALVRSEYGCTHTLAVVLCRLISKTAPGGNTPTSRYQFGTLLKRPSADTLDNSLMYR